MSKDKRISRPKTDKEKETLEGNFEMDYLKRNPWVAYKRALEADLDCEAAERWLNDQLGWWAESSIGCILAALEGNMSPLLAISTRRVLEEAGAYAADRLKDCPCEDESMVTWMEMSNVVIMLFEKGEVDKGVALVGFMPGDFELRYYSWKEMSTLM
jgi:hypothetical protein